MLEYLLIFVCTIFLVHVIQCTIKPKKFPPGPRWYPFVGSSGKMYSLMQKHGSQFKALLEMSKEYCTDVLGLNLGGELLIVFFGEKLFKEVLSAEEFDGRPDSFFMKMRCLGKRAGISLVDGPLWKIHRRFTMKHLRNAGFGKGTMGRDIGVGARELVDWITRQGNQALWPKDFLPIVILNILWKYTAGERIPTEKFEYLRQLLEKRGKAFTLAGGLLNRVPWIRFLLPRYSGYSMLVEVNQQISVIIEEAIKRHKEKKVDGHDFIYAFLDEMAQNRETFTDSQLVVTCIDLILAGSATTAHSLEFAILQALRDQNMQKKLQEEIDQVLGGELACTGDIVRLPYTAAFLQECHRVYTIAPLIGPRRVLKATTVAGYVIPKNATVLLSIGDIHVDPAYWEDPLEFKPERFLDDTTVENMCSLNICIHLVLEAIKRHKEKKVDGHDFIYAFLDEMAQNRETFTDSQLVVTCIDLILAGSATTAHSLEFAILQALRDQNMQKKLQEEIDQVLGGELACTGDIVRLPYTAAFLQECHRVYTIAPLIGPRRVLKATTVAGYVIPKNATVLLSIGDIHVDPAYWEDPLEFKPERFLDDSGKYVQSEHLYPFGFGRRRCPGEMLARMFAFISLVTLLQQFSISSVGDQPPSAEPVVGMFASACRFPALFKPRHA